MRRTGLYAIRVVTAALLLTSPLVAQPASAEAQGRRGRLDRLEDIRDRREDRRDRREDVRDRREDVRDARHDGGIRDRIEDRVDRRDRRH